MSASEKDCSPYVYGGDNGLGWLRTTAGRHNPLDDVDSASLTKNHKRLSASCKLTVNQRFFTTKFNHCTRNASAWRVKTSVFERTILIFYVKTDFRTIFVLILSNDKHHNAFWRHHYIYSSITNSLYDVKIQNILLLKLSWRNG